MVVHPAVGHTSGTLVNALLGYDPEMEGIGGEERPGVVHRLDKETSGLIVLAKNERAHRWLQDQFRLRKVEKSYLALVDGKPPTPAGRVETHIGRDPKNRKRMAVVSASKGREAISEYKTLESFRNHALLEFHPKPLAADIDLPSIRPMLTVARSALAHGRGSGIAGTAGHYGPVTLIVLNS